MKVALPLLPLLLFSAIATASEEENYITDLTLDNFDDFVTTEELVLVKFYMPWCKHCQRFASEFVKAAKALHAEKPSIKLAQVDCMLYDALAMRYNIKEYPSLKIFRKGGEVYDYVGGRNAYGITKHMISESFPITQSIGDTGALALTRERSTIVLYDSDPASPLATAYVKTAANLRGSGTFDHVTDPDIIKASGVPDGSVYAYNAFGVKDKTLVYERAAAADEEFTNLKKWCTRIYTPLVQLYTHNVEATYGTIGKPLLIVFAKDMDPVTNPSGIKYIVNRLKKVALEHVDDVSCVIMDVSHDDYGKCDFTYVRKYGVAIMDHIAGLKYCLDDALTEKVLKPDVIADFARAYVSGTLEPFFKSEKVHEVYDGVIRPLVRSQLVEDFLTDQNEQSYLLEVYTPWCSLCEDIRPTYEMLAELYLPMAHRFEFAMIDATKNDLPREYATNGYPTLFWVEAGKGSKPEVYEDMTFNRELIEEFISKKLAEHPSPVDNNNAKKDEL